MKVVSIINYKGLEDLKEKSKRKNVLDVCGGVR